MSLGKDILGGGWRGMGNVVDEDNGTSLRILKYLKVALCARDPKGRGQWVSSVTWLGECVF